MPDPIAQILAQVLRIDASTVTDELGMANTPAWDSLNHMNIIVGIENAFKTELTFDEISEMRSVAEIRQVLSARETA